MNRLRLLFALLAAALLVPAAAHGAVTAAQLKSSDVVADAGATLSSADRAKLQHAADVLRAKTFPTKFVVLATTPKDPDATAAALRAGLAKIVGLDNIDAVLVLAPHGLGISANAFASEIQTAFKAELPVLKTDGPQGMINVAGRLQYRDQIAALPGDDKPIDRGGFSPLIIAALSAVGLAGLLAFFFAHRAARRGEARKRADAEAAA